MSTRSTRHGRGGARWPSGQTCRQFAPALFAALGVALALVVHGVTAEAAGHPASTAHARAHGPAHRHGDHDQKKDEERRGDVRPARRAVAAVASTRPAGTGRGQPGRGLAAPASPAAPGLVFEVPVASHVSAAVSSAVPHPASLPGAAPALTLPSPPRPTALGTTGTGPPLNAATLAAFLLAVAVAATAVALARRRA